MFNGFLNGGKPKARAKVSSFGEDKAMLCTLAFFKTLTDAQRDMLAGMGSMTSSQRSVLGNILVAAAVTSQSVGESTPGLEKLLAAGGTGPAFVAFGERAVVHSYISKQKLDRIAVRLTSYPTPEECEAETAKAMRRFIACGQPLTDVRLVGCPVRHKSAPKVDLNGLRATMGSMGASMPSGTPERYNVAVRLPSKHGGDDLGEAPKHIVQVEPKYLRPCPLAEDVRDPAHAKIPEDHAAEEWWAEQQVRYKKLQRAISIRRVRSWNLSPRGSGSLSSLSQPSPQRRVA